MRVLLVGPDLEENLSLRYLSSALGAAGHDATIAAFDSEADEERTLTAAADADLVGLSLCYQVRAPEFLSLARRLKRQRPERPIIAGGHFASCAARELLEHHPEIDLVAIHEGESTLVELAGSARRDPASLAAVRGIVYRDGDAVVATPPHPIREDLDELPWPDRSGPARLIAGVPSAYLMGSRGCVGACDYCCITTLHRLAPGRRFRQRRPETIAQEMSWLYHQRGVRQFIFHDDNFLVPAVRHNLERVEALDRALRLEGVRHIGLVLKCRPADVDRQVFLRLREMGLLRVFLGIESGSAAGLASIGRQQTVDQAHRALEICEDLDLSSQYTIILFHPEATPETMLTDLSFVRQHPAHPLSFCRAEAYAGTPLERRMLAAGRATGDYLARAYRYTDPVTTLVWSQGRGLLRERCWSQQNLLGQVIRIDHQAATLRHFYDGRQVDALVADFLRTELEVNRDTVALFEELIRACVELPDAASPELQQRLAALCDRERETRERLARRICELRQALHDHAYGTLGLSRGAPRPVSRFLALAARHAAAAILALGIAACDKDDGGVIEAPPPPLDAAVGDGSRDGAQEDAGVIEAPPPPVDGGGDVQEDGGVIEAPPPPVDGGGDVKEDSGVIEAPPPPVDGGH